jgi:hypothetical protein
VSAGLRSVIAFGFGGLALALGLTGTSEALVTKAAVAGLRVLGPGAVQELGPCLFAVGQNRYRVDFWCTPTILILCLCFLLWFAGQRPLAYSITALSSACVATLSMIGNILLSIYLQSRFGFDWTWAHRPGLIAIYAVLLGACLLFIRGRLRPAREPRAH